MASRAILSNFFKEQWTQNHSQNPSGLSCALFPTTFREIVVYKKEKQFYRHFETLKDELTLFKSVIPL